MLCTVCNNITVPPSDEDNNNNIKTLIRQYQSVWSLAAYAKICNFCALIHDDPRLLKPKSLAGFQQQWGEEVYEQALNEAVVNVYFINDPARGHQRIQWKLVVNSSEVEMDGGGGGRIVHHHHHHPSESHTGYLDGIYFRGSRGQECRLVDAKFETPAYIGTTRSWYEHEHGHELELELGDHSSVESTTPPSIVSSQRVLPDATATATATTATCWFQRQCKDDNNNRPDLFIFTAPPPGMVGQFVALS